MADSDTKEASAPMIEVRGLHKAFDGRVPESLPTCSESRLRH